MTTTSFTLNPIGRIRADGAGFRLEIAPAYRAALRGLEGFSHLNVLWWFDGCDDPSSRALLEIPKPYQRAPESLGIFATRSPQRPNPIALTPIYVFSLETENGLIRTPFIDAMDQSPILDIKPYHPAVDRVRDTRVPSWCQHWPQCYEESGNFDWSQEFVDAR
jgi:tRNA-Thr(GGU) m(6)t(6)A37 methyltransferase TsaA